MSPWDHAVSSAKKFGGTPTEYIRIHNWFDETKQYTGDWTHRAMRHHAAGIQWCVEKFGHSVITQAGDIPTKKVAELHVIEDCGFIPTIQDWMTTLKANPSEWMLKVKTKTEIKFKETV
jgi:hypothetical protein